MTGRPMGRGSGEAHRLAPVGQTLVQRKAAEVEGKFPAQQGEEVDDVVGRAGQPVGHQVDTAVP